MFHSRMYRYEMQHVIKFIKNQTLKCIFEIITTLLYGMILHNITYFILTKRISITRFYRRTHTSPLLSILTFAKSQNLSL